MEECPICYDDVDDETGKSLSCSHKFHHECLEKWMGMETSGTDSPHFTCPTCRNPLSYSDVGKKNYRGIICRTKRNTKHRSKYMLSCTDLSHDSGVVYTIVTSNAENIFMNAINVVCGILPDYVWKRWNVNIKIFTDMMFGSKIYSGVWRGKFLVYSKNSHDDELPFKEIQILALKNIKNRHVKKWSCIVDPTHMKHACKSVEWKWKNQFVPEDYGWKLWWRIYPTSVSNSIVHTRPDDSDTFASIRYECEQIMHPGQGDGQGRYYKHSSSGCVYNLDFECIGFIDDDGYSDIPAIT